MIEGRILSIVSKFLFEDVDRMLVKISCALGATQLDVCTISFKLTKSKVILSHDQVYINS